MSRLLILFHQLLSALRSFFGAFLLSRQTVQMMNKELFTLIDETAKAEGLDQNIVMAIVMVESAGNPYAVRFEQFYPWFYMVRECASKFMISYDTEKACQQMSWGLMQVMGAVAREYGHQGDLTRLVDPALSLKYGIMHFKKALVRYGTMEDAVAAYNAGSVRKTDGGFYENQAYVNKVMKRYRELTKLK